jgi:hypothetical protein
MNLSEAQDIVSQIEFEGYAFKVLSRNGVLYLQAEFTEADIITGEPSLQKTRKWMLSEHMVRSEVVQTAFKCALTSAEHRVRESFKYRGERIYGPHFDCEALVEIAKGKRLDYRGRRKEQTK